MFLGDRVHRTIGWNALLVTVFLLSWLAQPARDETQASLWSESHDL